MFSSSPVLVNDYTCSNTKVVLCAIEDASRIVVKLDHANVEAFAGPDVQAATKRTRKASVRFCKIRAGGRKDSSANDIGENNLVPGR